MKKIKVEQFRIVHSERLGEYNEALNAAMKELREKEPRVEFHAHDSTYAIIRYTEVEIVPETVADEYELQGIRFTCYEDCANLEGRDDGRRRYYHCKYKSTICYGDRCCEEFYKKRARNEDDWRII